MPAADLSLPTRLDRLLRPLATGAQRLRRTFFRLRRPRTFGVHAAALTPAGTLILVRLRYARGWRLPGGGHPSDEDAEHAVLRELREEIGMTAHGEVRLVGTHPDSPDFKRETGSLFLVRDVRYRPRWSLEVEAVFEADIDALPEAVTPRTRHWLTMVRPLLGDGP